MTISEVRIAGARLRLVSVNTLIVGSGAAALNAAVRLHASGIANIAVAAERFGGGTSFEAGSDKQTYYKLSLAGDSPDSPLDMARDLASGGAMHGDIALCEALGSARAFTDLVGLGVPFPHDRFGAFVGYKTDHDPRRRATSAGPLTSRFMAEALAAEAKRRRIPVFDHHPVIGLFTAAEGPARKVIGAMALDEDALRRGKSGFVLFNAVNIILGTGGPAGIYQDSVYPESQTGSHGLAFEIGAVGQNLTESQFGLASVQFRWNLSGTYQQALPRYFSTDGRGGGEREFLAGHFPGWGAMATAIFLKGYQWPFDPRKIAGSGSSLIDVLVYRETVDLKRRVFLDYRRNPGGDGKGPIPFHLLSPEAREYLERSGALLPTPLARLRRMNPPAYELFRSHGIDLGREPLEIRVCAQHNNGGLLGNIWWESNIRHLFPVGEVNGSHGVTRPGGSALNAGQVGSLRAAQYIAHRYAGRPPAAEEFLLAAQAQIEEKQAQAGRLTGGEKEAPGRMAAALRELRRRISRAGGPVRRRETIVGEAEAAWKQLRSLRRTLRVSSPRDLAAAFRTLDLCLTHALYLEAAKEYLAQGGRSRGSFLVLDPKGRGSAPALGDEWRFSLAGPDDSLGRKILEISLDESGSVRKRWVDARPIPDSDAWFESVWADFREDRIFREE